jgi:hypothetical protein
MWSWNESRSWIRSRPEDAVIIKEERTGVCTVTVSIIYYGYYY